MAFQAGRESRRRETIQDQATDAVIDPHTIVGVYTHDERKSDLDRLCAAVLLYKKEHTESTIEINCYSDLEDKIKELKKSKEDIMQYIYPILKLDEKYCFHNKVLDMCTTPTNQMKVVNTKGVDHFEYAHASEFPVEEDHLQFLQEISAFDDEKILYPTTKVKFLDSIWSINSKDCSSDLLGLYLKIKNANDELVPQVWLFMNNIFETNKRYCDDHNIIGEGRKNSLKYIIAYVYIHEMMHRYFDIRPDLNLKRSIPQIEEPMAEYATLKFCESFGDDLLLKIAVDMVKEKRNGCFSYYALGYDLYEKDKDHPDLIAKYRRVSMIIHRDNEPYRIIDINSIVSLINKYDTDLQKAGK